MVMIKNYFKIAWRHLNKNKLYTVINLVGLVIGITGSLLIGVYISHEMNYDSFHTKSDRIVRVVWEYSYDNTEKETALTGTKVGPEFTRRFPETEAYVRLMKYPRVLTTNNKMFEEENFIYADSSFFRIFSFPLLEGDPTTALNAPQKLVLTESAAKKYFGLQNPLGRIINVGGTKDFIVTGVAADPPANSQIQFDMLGSFASLNTSKEESWGMANYYTYLLLKDEQALPELQAKIHSYMEEVGFEEMQMDMTYNLEPLEQVHLHSDLDGLEPNSDIMYVYILGGVAFLILLIACVNYTNLSTAQSAGRSAEIGMRRVMGAGKKDIFLQFISETFLLTLLAVMAALALSFILMPYFNQLAGRTIETEVLFEPFTLISLLILSLIIVFLAGTYPALILASGRVIKILKKGFTFTGSARLRRGLIVFQFVISVFLIVATVVILQQLDYIQSKDLGYSKDQVVILPIDGPMRDNYDALRTAIAQVPGVGSVAAAYDEPTHIGWGDALTSVKTGQKVSVTALPADENIIKTLDFEIVAGEDYRLSDVKLADPNGDVGYTYILNEAAARALGWDPEEVIGKTIAKEKVGREGIVRAVIKDFHFRSLHEPIGPLMIFIDKRLVRFMFIKISGNDISKTLAGIEDVWEQRVSHRPFEYEFLDESYAAMYKAEQSIAGVFTVFSLVAILLACLGLFALTAYAMVRRTKEIGIRKILGASIADILALVSKDFVKLVLIAVVIAIPLAYFAVDKWLEGFSYRVDLKWWVFALSSVTTIFIALITISLQAAKTAMSNPVNNLRNE